MGSKKRPKKPDFDSDSYDDFDEYEEEIRRQSG